MRSAFLSLGAFLLAAAALAQPSPFSADFASGGRLRIHARSGEVHIVGTDQNKISVEVSGKKANQAADLQVRLKEKGGATELRVSGGPKNEITLTIRIPRDTDLYARIPFGEVHVENVLGNKDIEMHAGDLTVAVGDAAASRASTRRSIRESWTAIRSERSTAACSARSRRAGAANTACTRTSGRGN